MSKTFKPKVFVAMSGGVDSSLAAALLTERGFDVHGVFMKTWQIPGKPCSAAEDRRDAMRVAAKLGIPFHTFDFSEEYKHSVVDSMLREYAAGRTPNPDVMCNREIKFGAFLSHARDLGAAYVATGHYARLGREFPISHFPASARASAAARASVDKQAGEQFSNKFQNLKSKTQNETVTLLQAKDKNKDQTYFLWTLTQGQLQQTLFPVGEYTKSEVRQMARERGIVTADKRESQGLCFLGKIDVRAFLAERLGAVPGSVRDAASGKEIGEHCGAALYTLGQRHGFRIRGQSPLSEPLYVVGRDMGTNTITVAPRLSILAEPFAREVVVVNMCNWIGALPERDRTYAGRIRHRGELVPCRVQLNDADSHSAQAVFDYPLLAASGQSLVFYDGECVRGGGVIV